MKKRLPVLTERQEEVLALIGDGYSYPRIGEMLGISESGVRKIVQRIWVAFDVRSKQELVVLSRRYFLRAGVGE